MAHNVERNWGTKKKSKHWAIQLSCSLVEWIVWADVPDAARDAGALWISVTVVGCITEGAGSGFVALVLFTAISAFVIVCT